MLWEAEKSSEILGKAVLSSIAKKVKVQSNPEGVPLWIEANIDHEFVTEKIKKDIQANIPTNIVRQIGYEVYVFVVDENYYDDHGNVVIPEHGVTFNVAYDIGFGFGFSIGVKVTIESEG